MAKREALRDLQSRLAARLQDARSGEAAASWLAVESGPAHFLLPLSQAGEIFPYAAAQSVPYTQPWFLGVCNLRGALFGVVDLDAFVHQHPVAPQADVARQEARLVGFNPVLEMNGVLLVDRLAGLRSSSAFTASDAAAPGSPAFFGSVYTDAQGTRWQELNLQMLSQLPEFLSIRA